MGKSDVNHVVHAARAYADEPSEALGAASAVSVVSVFVKALHISKIYVIQRQQAVTDVHVAVRSQKTRKERVHTWILGFLTALNKFLISVQCCLEKVFYQEIVDFVLESLVIE